MQFPIALSTGATWANFKRIYEQQIWLSLSGRAAY